MKAYEVSLSTLICGEIENPTEAATRFCIEVGIPVDVRDKLVFKVKNIDTDTVTNVEYDTSNPNDTP